MGIGGSGISAVAALAKAYGYQVSGCDLAGISSFSRPLLKEGITIYNSHSPEHLKNTDIFCVTPAIFDLNPDHPEFLEAKNKKIMMTWQEFIGRFLMPDKFVIAVAGTHGKSTTTAMIGVLLEEAGLDPSVMIGATVLKWQRNYRVGKSKYFVVEADEFNDNFLHYRPNLLVITNIEMDHPEYFANFEAVLKSFQKLIKQMSNDGKLILFNNLRETRYSRLFSQTRLESIFYLDEGRGALKLKIPGEHNLWNATAALKVAEILGIDKSVAIRALNNFAGTARRFEFKGESGGAKIFDDYAHHPTEIRAMLQAAREKFPENLIWAVFQPHQISRLKTMLDDFAISFDLADKIVITDIFLGREKHRVGEVLSQDLVKKIQNKEVRHIGSLDEVVEYLKKNIKRGEVVINIGAGDIYQVSEKLIHLN